MAPNMCEHLSLQSELANGFTIPTRLLGGSRRGEFQIFNAEGVESLSNGNLSFGIKKSIRELLSLYNVKDR
jgi:hypothetical protein